MEAGGDEPTSPDVRPKHLTKHEFGRRLYNFMLRKGWSQSELARRADVKRDSVSTYVRGVSLPGPLNLEKLAKALDVDTAELLPNHIEAAIDEDAPSLELKISSSNSQLAWLRVNRLVSTSAAMKVVEILNSDELPESKEG
ncbi:helix-turn-helix protein [Phaeobacter inhibens]|uniref:Helix-turn-helix protein n=2 Tax=Phaeobacter inhibens TaxID=221822 RepID=A0ABM6RHN9_9RHOB|nr:helix-turn-helix protein [Phaeobacter inhibens]